MVEGMGLALAPVLASKVHDVARVLEHLGLDHVGGVVGGGVVDDVDPEPVEGVVQLHQPVDRRADDQPLVPGRDEDGRAGKVVVDLVVVVDAVVEGDQQELVRGRQQRDRPDHHDDDERPLETECDLPEHVHDP